MTTTADTGVADNDFGSALDGSAAFLSNLMPPKERDDAEKLSDKGGETKPEQSTQETEETEETSDESPEETEETEETEEAKQPEKKYVDSDDVFVKIKVGDQELEIPVKDLKRLHGQEAALTRKGQEVAEQRKSVETQRTVYAAKLDGMLKKATAVADQYRQVNFMALMKDPNVTPDMLNALQTEARQAFEQETYLKSDLKEFTDGVQKERQDSLRATASETVKTLSDETSPLHIEGWGQKTYDEIRQFAIANGIPSDDVNQLVSAPAIKIIHMAMMFKKGASKVTTKVVNNTPKKIIKQSSRNLQPKSSKPVAQQQKAMKALQEHGSQENATNAFLSNWQSADTE